MTNPVKRVEVVFPGIQGPAGPGSGGSDSYEFIQSMATDEWTINHNLERYPSVTIRNTDDEVVYGDVVYTTLNTVTVTFSDNFAGKAYLI